MKILFLLLLLPVFLMPTYAESQQLPTDKGTLLVNIATEPAKPSPDEQVKLKIDFVNPQTNQIQEHIDYIVTVTNGEIRVFGPIPLTHTSIGSVTIPIEFASGENKVSIDVEGILFKPIPSETVTFTVMVETPQATSDTKSGCLIATAAFGTELAPQVQTLREIRDNTLFGTGSGTAFMAGFNEFYYTFSPAVADLQRQNPIFKEAIRVTITPMLSTLSILSYVDINSESEMLGYGIGVILLNVGMYFVVPVIIMVKIKNYLRRPII
ncbi:MAG: copper-binding protein [Nitrososphaerota archaeon]|nr:copper-binding protein [Nitrososphaerota archaeon]